jgi:uncharacterized phage protein (TIGR01671 family)
MNEQRQFRGKRKDNGEWVYGWYCEVEEKHFIIPFDATNHNQDTEIMGFDEVIPSSVGQSTGPKDKNGVEIFEGDICMIERKYGEEPEDLFPPTKSVVENLGWAVEYKFMEETNYKEDSVDLGLIAQAFVEVIGNIHEGKE